MWLDVSCYQRLISTLSSGLCFDTVLTMTVEYNMNSTNFFTFLENVSPEYGLGHRMLA